MELVPAIDLLGGRARRLERGDYGAPLPVSADPVELAAEWLEAGVRWLHVVDLDGARAGRPVHVSILRALSEMAHRAGARLEAGGGLRDGSAIETVLNAGTDVALLGTAAVASPDFAARCARRWPGRIGLSLDLRGGRPAVEAWLNDSDADAFGLVDTLVAAGVGRLAVTDVERDGTNAGPNVELMARFRSRYPRLTLLAAGGIASTADLEALRGIGADGAIVGRALLDGSLPVGEALAACSSVAV